jgi:LAO/AO transport system kinase
VTVTSDPQVNIDRRQLARDLTRVAGISVAESLSDQWMKPAAAVRRIGVTGPPGAGKSTLIAKLAETRLERCSSIGVLAVDPTSPVSGGSILGDRIRMEEVASNPRIYIRSMPSMTTHDGLTHNVSSLLAVMDRYGFDEVFLETVGSGQVDYAIRTLVDTVILVLAPESGDLVQAMKAGIMEMADIYVINKADRPGARKSAADISAVLKHKPADSSGWRPTVLVTSQQDNSLDELNDALESHLQWHRQNTNSVEQNRARTRYHVESLLQRHASELLDGADDVDFDQPLRQIYDKLVQDLARESHAPYRK